MTCLRKKFTGSFVNQNGSVLIAIISTMVIIAGLGVSLLNMTTSTTTGQLGAMDTFRAYYLAESGGRYALPIIQADLNSPATLIAQLDGTTYTFANGDSFQLSLSYTAPDYTLVSIGTLAQGTQVLSAIRTVNYTITNPGPGGGGQTDIPFDTPADLTDNFTWQGPAPAYMVDDPFYTDGSPALYLQDERTYLKLDWDGNPGLPNLLNIWATNGNLLSYDLQVKIKVINPWLFNPEFLVGLSFREDGNRTYGISFLKRDTCWTTFPNAFCNDIPGASTNLYVVLWLRNGNNYSVIDYHLVDAADNILTGNDLTDWSTLVVRVEETDVGVRRNLITAYVQGPGSYPRHTISWDFGLFNELDWASGDNPVEDATRTTVNFDSLRPTEIGLHSLSTTRRWWFWWIPHYIFMDDFSINIGGGAGGPGDVEQF